MKGSSFARTNEWTVLCLVTLFVWISWLRNDVSSRVIVERNVSVGHLLQAKMRRVWSAEMIEHLQCWLPFQRTSWIYRNDWKMERTMASYNDGYALVGSLLQHCLGNCLEKGNVRENCAIACTSTRIRRYDWGTLLPSHEEADKQRRWSIRLLFVVRYRNSTDEADRKAMSCALRDKRCLNVGKVHRCYNVKGFERSMNSSYQ